MSPRFDRRRDQGQGSGPAGSRPGRPGRPDSRGGSRRPFAPRGEWRPDRTAGGERSERADRPSFSRRPERGDRPRPERYGERSRPERRFDTPRYGGDETVRSDRPPSDRPRFDRPRFDSPRGSGSRSGSERRPGRPNGQGRPTGRPNGRSSFQDRRFDRRPLSGDRDQAPPSRPLIVDAPSGESDRFNAGPADDLIWGRHAAQAALESDRPIHRIWCTPEMRFQPRFMQLLREAKAGGVLVEEVTWSRLGQLTDGAVHQGIVLQAAAADTLDLGSLIDGCRSLGEPPLLMALDGITDPHNLGAIVRSAEALGAHGLVLPQRRSAGLTGSVAKVAAGALEHLPVARVVNLNRSLETLKEEGYRVVGLAGEAGVALSEADLDGPLVIVTGSEGSGLSMLTRKHCDQLVRIPLRGATPSLNASVATAMVLYEVARRGWMKQITGSAPAPRIVRPQIASAPIAAPEAVNPVPEPETEANPVPNPEQEQQPELEPMLQLHQEAPAFTAEQSAAAQQLVDEVVLSLAPKGPESFSGDIKL
ncbi:23S rRNA (guanosine(2251)-2'-O)-methyltransferase RlmB [Synechococcus sp. LA31]|uniref:23S rRNA (guanosine(2251)-2'-O)-methyltransferase RlmB n=1 Tax=Synechococcus sp. LA31 TaxID=2741953 RepID=UPI001BDD8E19|nr:23S rRNA (guanosine(2251)-2'-O)-methyltransferase RlmB [Synechococcus sp. LA31]QVV68253.1 23S rRNA (guanosine(2251)-2'-O)-methyltransferase RlmB [Synechococcus sp. LA31]